MVFAFADFSLVVFFFLLILLLFLVDYSFDYFLEWIFVVLFFFSNFSEKRMALFFSVFLTGF